MKKITLDLPSEFLELCKQDNIEPETVLRGFIADLCGIMNFSSNPREDSYSSNGSDERDLARSYYERVGYPHWNGNPPEK
ncbi:hypothetical protein ACD661_15315 [Legionella lytica]|uniref:Uncharacterized protein n=1 Tax=Legionella lytica TaxID=96232 RepID=A0ABW8DCL1_9GAMM